MKTKCSEAKPRRIIFCMTYRKGSPDAIEIPHCVAAEPANTRAEKPVYEINPRFFIRASTFGSRPRKLR